MRKSSALITLIMLGGFGALFFAADISLKPLAEDGRVARDLTRLLAARGDLEAGSKVRCRRFGKGTADPAAGGRGLRIRLSPSDAVKARRMGLSRLAHRTAEAALDAYRGQEPAWVETTLRLDDEEPPRELRVRLRATPEGLLRDGPPLPVTWPPPPREG